MSVSFITIACCIPKYVYFGAFKVTHEFGPIPNPNRSVPNIGIWARSLISNDIQVAKHSIVFFVSCLLLRVAY